MTDILDITDIFYFPWAEIIAASLCVLLFLTFLGLILRWVKKRRRSIDTSKPTASPDAEAQGALAALLEKKYVENGEFRKYYFELDEIFRRYLLRRFGLPAPDQTTPEILAGLRRIREVSNAFLKNVPLLLQRADLSKFARYKPEVSECLADYKEVLSFVMGTTSTEKTAA